MTDIVDNATFKDVIIKKNHTENRPPLTVYRPPLQSMIAQKTVQAIFEAVRIEDIVGEFVTLKRRGVNMIGVCPFHNEKTPSFTVSPSKNIYKCFGCGEAGNSINFLMEHENISYPEAMKYVAKKYGIEVEETGVQVSNEERDHLESLYLVTQLAKDYFHDHLLNSDEGRSIGLSYFKERGFREETIKKFGLGFAPNRKDAFTLNAVNKGYKQELLKQVGLTTSYGRDFFRNRVQFPIHNLTGKVIGFGGRILVKNVKAPKYINTPETEIYNKSKVLYGSYFAKKSIRRNDECIMVEGYTDVISLHQSGIENVVSSSGTSLTREQIQLIRRFTPNMKIIYDGDTAGVKAALRGLDLVLEENMNVRIVLLPEGEDPDSYVKKVGTAAFKEYISEKAQDFILFKTNLIIEETKHDPIKKAELLQDIVKSIAKIPDPIKRSVYIKECATLMDMNEDILINASNKLVVQLARNAAKKAENSRNYQANKNRSQGNKPPSNSTPQAPNNQGGQEEYPPEFFEQQYQQEQQAQQEQRGDYKSKYKGKYTGKYQQEEPPPPQIKKPEVLADDFQEKFIVRLLVEFSDKPIEEDISVAEYVLANMEELLDEFDNDLYGKLVREAYNFVEEGNTLTPSYFMHHPTSIIQKMCADLLSSPFVYSENWEAKLGKPLQTQPMPEENFERSTKEGVDRFKLKKVLRLSRRNQERLKNCDPMEMMHILKVQMKLKEMSKELTTILRIDGSVNLG